MRAERQLGTGKGMRPTSKDLARAAGVSLATVDRVLNGRAGVRQPTVDAVNEAIARIGFVRNLSAANLARRRTYRFEYLLPRHGDQFIETVVALRNRGDLDSEWKILAGPFADGRPNPRLCPHDDLRQHWLVMRVSA